MTSYAVNIQPRCSQLEEAVKLQSNWYLQFKFRNSRYFLSLPTFWLQTVSQINKNAVIVQIALQWWKSRKGLQSDLPLTVQVFMQLISSQMYIIMTITAIYNPCKSQTIVSTCMRTSWLCDSEIWTLDNLLIKDWNLFNFLYHCLTSFTVIWVFNDHQYKQQNYLSFTYVEI